VTSRSSKDQFNAHVDKYAVSDVHRAGPSLPVLLALAQPVHADQSLDIATAAEPRELEQKEKSRSDKNQTLEAGDDILRQLGNNNTMI
jgi:hypothetical protein